MRQVVSLAAGCITALLLFLLMHHLVGTRQGTVSATEAGEALVLLRVKPDERVISKPPRETEPPKPLPRPPATPTAETPDPAEPWRGPVTFAFPELPGSGGAVWTGPGSQGGGPPDGAAVAVVRIEPQWPRQAALAGIEGWVEVAFTIRADGSVADVVVIAAEPQRVFDQSAVHAVRKWRFKPRVVDGRAVEQRAAQRIEFALESDR
jgi:protein TonB